MLIVTGLVNGQTIDIEKLEHHAAILANDSLQGRTTGSVGAQKAAKYIASELKKSGIAPFSKKGTFFQSVPIHGSTPLPTSELKLFYENDFRPLELKTDYLLSKTGAQTFVPKPLDLVFVGYGIVAPEYDYNDYQNLDVLGKIVVYLSGEPHTNDSTYFDGPEPTIYSYPESKERLAMARGARGSILIPTLDALDHKKWEKWVRDYSFEGMSLPYAVTSHFSIILHPDVAYSVFANAPKKFGEILYLEKHKVLESFPLDAKISFKGQFKERNFYSYNVIGKIEGTDPKLKNSYVVLSAHYDHLGIGPPVKSDSIYNGLVDNSLGVAGLLEIAKTLKNNPPKRSVIVLFVTGEEKGVLGSQYFIHNPLIPHYKTVANINIDGLAIFDRFNEVVGLGAEFSTLGEMLEILCKQKGLKKTTIPDEFNISESFARSDQISFALAGIPTILITDGVDYKTLSRTEGINKHKNWMRNIYHSPKDDLEQPINWDAVEQHATFLYAFIRNISNSMQEPKWHPGSRYINARLQSIAEKR